jgi:hypothetical protein
VTTYFLRFIAISDLIIRRHLRIIEKWCSEKKTLACQNRENFYIGQIIFEGIIFGQMIFGQKWRTRLGMRRSVCHSG